MLSKRKGLVLMLTALLAVTASLPMAGASNITTVVNPQTGSANVTAYVNTTATVKTNSTGFLSIINDLANFSGNTSLTLNSNNRIFMGMQNAMDNNTTAARITYLNLQANTTVNRVTSEELIINHTLRIVMNVSNIYNNGTFDMGWRAFNDNASVNISHQDYNHFTVGNVSSSNYLNFTAFSEPLNSWKRVYDSATNTTTFSKDAGTTLNFYSNTSFLGFFLNVSVQSDPSYSIVTPGYATAGTNSITISSQPGHSFINYLYYAIPVGIVAIGVGVAVSLRRRRS